MPISEKRKNERKDNKRNNRSEKIHRRDTDTKEKKKE